MRTIELFRSLIPPSFGRHPPHRVASAERFRRPEVLEQDVALAGFQYHRAMGVWPFLVVGVELKLRRERLNPHDHNAISVWFKNDRLGYIPRETSRVLAVHMDRGDRVGAHIIRLRESEDPRQRIRIRVERIE